MALPYVFSNTPPTNHPDGNKIYANFTYLDGMVTGGAGIKTDSTISELHAVALAAPTVAFMAIPTDLPALMLYTGNATRGPEGNGFIALASWEEIS